jgi:hypothetical protein
MEKSRGDIDLVKQESLEKQSKLEGIYKDIQNLEWKEDVVLGFLERVETDLATLISK